MNEQNLTMAGKGITNKETAQRLGRLGGAACKNNPNHRLACKLRDLKKKGLSDDNAKRLYEIMSSPELSALDILLHLDSIGFKELKTNERINLLNAMTRWHEMTHGKKINSINTNLNYNTPFEIHLQYDRGDTDMAEGNIKIINKKEETNEKQTQ